MVKIGPKKGEYFCYRITGWIHRFLKDEYAFFLFTREFLWTVCEMQMQNDPKFSTFLGL